MPGNRRCIILLSEAAVQQSQQLSNSATLHIEDWDMKRFQGKHLVSVVKNSGQRISNKPHLATECVARDPPRPDETD